MSTFGERMRALGHAWERLEHKPMYWPFVREPQQPSAVHPARARIHETRNVGERVADRMAGAVGSWKFIIGQSCFIVAWIALNSIAFLSHWDPYPWILLNLCMSTQAMYTGPILLLASNRQAAKDRARDDLEAHEVEQSTAILTELRELTHDLHSHTTCVGHTTIGDTPPVTTPPAKPRRSLPGVLIEQQQKTTRKARVKA